MLTGTNSLVSTAMGSAGQLPPPARRKSSAPIVGIQARNSATVMGTGIFGKAVTKAD